MEQLRASGAEKHTTLLLGAGASTTSGLPGWDALATRLLVGSGSVDNDGTAQLLLARQDPLIVVEAARAAYGEAVWLRKVRGALYEGVASTEFSPLQLATVAHVLGGEPTETSVITLNFDILLEQALEQESGEKVLSSTTGSATAEDGSYVVHHLHGVVSPVLTESVVLTLTDFLDLISVQDSWQMALMREAIGRGALIIAGTSYRDPDVRQWLHTALKEAPIEHAAIVLLARQGFDVDKSEFAKLERALSAQWTAVGMRPVLMHDFSDAAQVIRELRHLNEDGYLAPQERTRLIWDFHAKHFAALQEIYVAELGRNAEAIRRVVGVDRLNLTLWLADGHGQLARWAAQDRVYLEAAGLRTVETGYDSPWIAGKALGSDTLLFQDLPSEHTRRWRSVLALPVPAPHPTLPTMTSAVLTIGLPDLAVKYEGSKLMWGPLLGTIGDEWSTRLTEHLFLPPTGITIGDTV
ncbi:hypothetical protein E3T48_03050 [Cryobacterium fucosi]|uniref:Uncharacterized protein n=2 Tax=Cryobacterium fucosi TaxID=1259157 RepID=A0A4R9BEA2_9MICO|nr:hypothetical protein E3T48_03050 [Cryobacterium fucosi]